MTERHKEKLLRLFGERLLFSRKSALYRLLREPRRMLYAKSAEVCARWAKRIIGGRARTFWGDDMGYLFPQSFAVYLYKFGFFEEGLTRMLLEYLEPGMTFFDIGANAGYFSLLAHCITGENGHVHSFEPTPGSFRMLKENVSTKPIILNNIAVFSKRGEILLTDYGVEYCGFNSVYESNLPDDFVARNGLRPVKHRIAAVSIDEYAREKGIRPDFVKIDAENAEYEILCGMEHVISAFRPMISLEVGNYSQKGVPANRELLCFLMEKGYRPYEYREGAIVKHDLKERYEYDNLLLLPG